ncbi:MAG: UTP--glucose-1-phosphate uridylyltransferase [Chloroflexi bacterium]|jgi:UTP--glucose-1-phosphate uridylyltransferase|nr:UTP--glucose-1-phosphate uridylyltransferase [Chloroflexota bacterium]
MKITKAVITAAGRTQRALPLQTVTDSDGVEKSVLAILAEETFRAGIEEVCVVVCPGDEKPYAEAVGAYANRLTFVQQEEPLGYGHAVYCARGFTRDEPFLHLVSDHLYVNGGKSGCAQDLVEMAVSQGCAVSAVEPSHESLLPYFGCVAGRRVHGATGLYEVDTVMEKPTPTDAEQWLVVSGLRAGHYLCFFGMHVLTPTVMGILSDCVAEAAGQRQVTLSEALSELARRERYLAMEIAGMRYDVGVKYGILMAQLGLALNGLDRELVLSRILELLARREQGRRGN